MTNYDLDVFISSQIKEFEKFRKYLEKKINSKKFLQCKLLEKRGAMPYPTLQASLKKVRRSDILVGFIGKNESSITRAEIKEALKKDIPCFSYIKDTKNRASEMEELIEMYIQPYGKYQKFSSIWKICKQMMEDLDDFLVELLRSGIEEHKNILDETKKKEKSYRESETRGHTSYSILLHQAKQSFEQQDYLSAVIKTGISMEIWLKKFIWKSLPIENISKRPMGWLIAHAKKKKLLDPKVIHDLLEIKFMRNNAVHMNRLPTKNEASFAMEAGNKILKHLKI